MPSIAQMQRFIAVAEELSFRKAAERLHLSQPPLSDAIRQLEAELGTVLLNRTSRSVALTRSGEVFLERSYRILAQLDEAVDATRAVAQGMSGRLAVGFNPTSTYDVLPRVLRRFRQNYPDVTYRFEELATVEQEDALQQKRIDVALYIAPTTSQPGIRQETVLREPLDVVLPEEHPLAACERIELGQLRHEPFIFVPPRWGTGYYARVSYACQQAGFTPRVFHEVERVHTQVSLVAAGLGVALSARSLRRFTPPGAVFRALDDPLSLFHVEFGVARLEADRSPLAAAFVETAREVGREGGGR